MEDEIERPKLQVLHFLVSNVRMCIDLKYIKKVLPLVQLERIPGSPVYLVGLLNLAGKSIPVIDLAMRLGLHRHQAYTIDMPILICFDNEHEVGFIIDKVLGLATID